MSVEDPFFVVKDEVQKALALVKNLFTRWKELQEGEMMTSHEEMEYTTNELRNSLRSIEWDLEDLEETVGIVEKNPRKFKISELELQERRNFVEKKKTVVRDMKGQISNAANHREDQRLSTHTSSSSKGDKFMQLDREMEQANQRYVDDTHSQQQMLIRNQDDQLDVLGSSVGVLKNMSQQIGNELEDQNIMLDEFHHEMDNTESKLDNTMKKMAKVMRMSNDRRQWCAIGVLSLLLLIIIIMFFTI